MNEALKLKIRL